MILLQGFCPLRIKITQFLVDSVLISFFLKKKEIKFFKGKMNIVK